MAGEDQLEPSIDDFFGGAGPARKLNAEEQKTWERTQKRKEGDLRKILLMPEGRRFIWEELCEAGIFQDGFSANSNLTANFLGRRRAGLDLLRKVMKAKPEAYAQMQQEYWSEQNKNGDTK